MARIKPYLYAPDEKCVDMYVSACEADDCDAFISRNGDRADDFDTIKWSILPVLLALRVILIPDLE